jgi:pilus assembly protein CpaB
VSRRRRAVLLLGLALVLGGLAASDVSRREAALKRQLGPPVPVVVARTDLPPGQKLSGAHVALRHVPARYAPAGGISSVVQAVGQRAAVFVPAGAYLHPGHVGATGADGGGSVLRAGERVADVVAVASPELVVSGSRVDVVVSQEGQQGEAGRTVLALEDVEVLAAVPHAGSGGAGSGGPGADAPRVAASLRVNVRQAVFLAASQSFAREVRLLARAPGDDRRGSSGLTVDSSLRG